MTLEVMIWISLAVVIGGLVSSTALTLVLLPILFRRFGVKPTLVFVENAHD